MKIRKITDLSYLEQITDWMFNWWGFEGYTKEQVRSHISRGFNEIRLPQTFGLFDGDALIGMYQITYEDLFIRPDIYPWLANVYIDEKFRGKGYGKLLLESVENYLKECEFSEIYLFTYHTGLYEKYGWEFIEEIDTFLEPKIQRLYRLRG